MHCGGPEPGCWTESPPCAEGQCSWPCRGGRQVWASPYEALPWPESCAGGGAPQTSPSAAVSHAVSAQVRLAVTYKYWSVFWGGLNSGGGASSPVPMPSRGQTSRSFALVSEGAHSLAGRVLHRAGIATPHLLPAASGLPVLVLGKVVQPPPGPLHSMASRVSVH